MPAKKTASAAKKATPKKAAPAPSTRSRAGMTVFARGTVKQKAEVFKEAARAAGYRVVQRPLRETGQLLVVAKKGEHEVTACWTSSGAWDWAATWDNARRGGKIRNLSAALKTFQ